MTYFKVVSQYLPAGTEKEHERPQSRYPMSWPKNQTQDLLYTKQVLIIASDLRWETVLATLKLSETTYR